MTCWLWLYLTPGGWAQRRAARRYWSSVRPTAPTTTHAEDTEATTTEETP